MAQWGGAQAILTVTVASTPPQNPEEAPGKGPNSRPRRTARGERGPTPACVGSRAPVRENEAGITVLHAHQGAPLS